MSYENSEIKGNSLLNIETRGLGIKTPDEFLDKSEFEIRFLYDDDPKHPHKLEVRIQLAGEPDQIFLPKPNSKIKIELKNAKAIEKEAKEKFEKELINLNKIHGEVLKDLTDMPLELIDVYIKADQIFPYSAELNNVECYTEKITGDSRLASFTSKFTRFIGADFELDNDSEINIEINNEQDNESVSIKPEGKNVSIILDNDCLSDKEDGYSDFKLYYDVLNGGDTRVVLLPANPNPVQPADLLVACNAIEGGNGGRG